MRAISVAFSPARPSRLKNEPGILPAAYMRSSTSTVSGRKSTSRRLPAVAVESTTVSPARDDDGAGGLLGHLARLEGDLGSADLDGDPVHFRHMSLSCARPRCRQGPLHRLDASVVVAAHAYASSPGKPVAMTRASSSSAPRATRAAGRRAAGRPGRAPGAGRRARKARLSELADRSAALEAPGRRDAPATRCSSCVEPGDVLVSTVGPFAKWGEPAVRAAIAAARRRTSTRPASRRSSGACSRSSAAPAERAGAALLTAMGYDFVPGALAGALALEEAGRGAVRVDVGYYALGMGATSLRRHARVAGRVMLDDGYAFRDGAVRARALGRARALVQRAGKDRARRSRVGGAEHFTLPASYPALREVNVYLGWFGPLSRPMQAASLARLAGRARPGDAVGAADRGRAGRVARRHAAGRVRRSPASSPRPTTPAAPSSPRCSSPAPTPYDVDRRDHRLGRAARRRQAPARSGRSRPTASRRSKRASPTRASPASARKPPGGQQRAREQVARLDAAVAAHPQRCPRRAVEELPAQRVERARRAPAPSARAAGTPRTGRGGRARRGSR